MRGIYHKYLRLPMLIRVGLILFIILISSAVIAHHLEKKTFHTLFEGFYWAVITAGTVGFGDIAPKTQAVRVLAIILVFLGGGYLAFLTAHFAATVIKNENRFFEGKNMYKNEEHIIIVGWNERSRNTLKTLVNEMTAYHLVLIDHSLKENPLYQKGIHYIQGKPSEDGTWIKANITKAKLVLITADSNLKEPEADMNTILSILTARGLNEKVLIHAEILTKEQSTNAKRAGADYIIHTSNLAAIEMVKHLKYK
ncbi:potassium channel family protein [Bacillus sp. NEB1478]|uniref:potassium channel family protein n=1 Tax=Bacillus sp. NEB1478 TaxID=3073816 RepID=UPI0028737C63|nr:potassium channel family protein [Bacillus sp. NEB1478]WNB93007.1 potassium channel family protein [Bacillus sp. NEB1478]